MITELQLSGFKAWRDTGPVRMAPLTVLFGANSAGKSSLLDFMRTMERTVSSADRVSLTLLPGQSLGGIVYGAQQSGELGFRVCWQRRPASGFDVHEVADGVCLGVTMVIEGGSARVVRFVYETSQQGMRVSVGMEAMPGASPHYRLIHDGLPLAVRERPTDQPLPPPNKFYIFPSEAYHVYDRLDSFAGLPIQFEQVMRDVTYVGPVRADPSIEYGGANERRHTVGERGEAAIPAAAAAGSAVELRLAEQLHDMGLIDGFNLHRLDGGRDRVQVRIRIAPNSPEVFFTDVGFGISQVLPVLVQCLIVPEYSTVILSHPEAHLHPLAQAQLADVLIAAVCERHLQLIVESHSEYFLHRLQRRIAEGVLPAHDAAMYFSSLGEEGEAHMTPLQLDVHGNISNWPPDFFGDVMGDLVAMAEAESGGALEG